MQQQRLPISPSVVSDRSQSSSASTDAPGRNGKVDHFTRWRPLHHLIAPKNWMNDPCGPCFDPSSGLYHISYQYNPKEATWGNMSWMHATSKDLVHWKHFSKEPRLVPLLPHDQEGIFSGCMLLQGPQGEEGLMTAIYTAISQLPIHFTKPYHWGSEKLALAISTDGGKNWLRDSSSLILSSPPEEFKGQIIGWRDPYVAPWPEMDEHLGLDKDCNFYGLISGGLKDQTPTAFLYRMARDDLKNWTFVSSVADIGLNFQLSSKSGDMGQNWELCNFFSLQDQQFLLMNVEGVGENKEERHAMWSNVEFCGSKLLPKKSGLVDYGCLYAVTTFLHSPSQRRLALGWITEDDLAESRYEQQGWSGCMSLPREMMLLTYNGVNKSVQSDLDLLYAYQIKDDGPNSLQLQTLGWRPAEETKELREGSKHFVMERPTINRQLIQSRNVEIEIDMTVSDDAKERNQSEIGLLVCHNASLSRYTKIVFRADAVHIIRSHSSKDPDVKTTEIVAPLKLLPFANGSLEKIHMRLFIDNSILELFINDRVAITTRIYCDKVDCNLVSLFNSERSVARFDKLQAWVGLQSAMIDSLTNGKGSKGPNL